MSIGTAWVAGWLMTVVAQGPSTTTARVEIVPLELTDPLRYQSSAALEPIRSLEIASPQEGLVRALAVPVGTTVRERQELVLLDREEAAIGVRIAEAMVKEKMARLKQAQASKDPASISIAEAQLDAAQAAVDLAKLKQERCTLRAPFAGKLLAASAVPGQYVRAGESVAELADVTGLRVLVAVDRSAVSPKSEITLDVEGQSATGQVEAIVPLPEVYDILRELAVPWAAAWIIVPNAKGTFEPGQRVRGPFIPQAPVATVPRRAIREPQAGSAEPRQIQVVRNDYVTNVPVKVLGPVGTERVQVAANLRANDALLVEAVPPLIHGTYLRYAGNESTGGLQGTPPPQNQPGTVVGISTPSNSSNPPRTAPIGAPGSNLPRGAGSAPAARIGPATKEAPKGGIVPF